MQTIHNVPPGGNKSDPIAVQRLMASRLGFLEQVIMDQSKGSALLHQNILDFVVVYHQVQSDTTMSPPVYEEAQEQIYLLIKAYTAAGLTGTDLMRAVLERQQKTGKFLDVRDLRLIASIFHYPVKFQRYELIKMLPKIYENIWAAGYNGLQDLADRGPATLQKVIDVNPSYFVSYVAVSQAWTGKEKQAGPGAKVLNAVVDAGVTQMSGGQFSSSKEKELRAEARKRAIQNAKEKATAMAAELNQKIGLPLQIEEAGGQGPVMPMQALAWRAKSVSAEDSISPGEMTIQSNVMVRFELQ
jgi:hypothetical protein